MSTFQPMSEDILEEYNIKDDAFDSEIKRGIISALSGYDKLLLSSSASAAIIGFGGFNEALKQSMDNFNNVFTGIEQFVAPTPISSIIPVPVVLKENRASLRHRKQVKKVRDSGLPPEYHQLVGLLANTTHRTIAQATKLVTDAYNKGRLVEGILKQYGRDAK